MFGIYYSNLPISPFLVVMGERFNGFWINVSVLIAKCVRLLVFPSYNIFYG